MTVYHPGELAVQQRMGQSEIAARLARHGARRDPGRRGGFPGRSADGGARRGRRGRTDLGEPADRPARLRARRPMSRSPSTRCPSPATRCTTILTGMPRRVGMIAVAAADPAPHEGQRYRPPDRLRPADPSPTRSIRTARSTSPAGISKAWRPVRRPRRGATPIALDARSTGQIIVRRRHLLHRVRGCRRQHRRLPPRRQSGLPAGAFTDPAALAGLPGQLDVHDAGQHQRQPAGRSG